MRRSLVLLLLPLVLAAQDRYIWRDKTANVCPLLDQRGSSPYQSYTSWSWRSGTAFIPPEKRQDVSAFTVEDESGAKTSLKDLKGRPVIVGLWSTHCEPSLFLLSEMAQLYGKAGKFGFGLFPTCFDREKWFTITPFVNPKRIQPLLQGVKIFTPESGDHGVHLFMEVVPALPAFFVIDREGRLAIESFGFKEGELSKCLKYILAEASGPAQPQAPVAAAPAKPSDPGAVVQ